MTDPYKKRKKTAKKKSQKARKSIATLVEESMVEISGKPTKAQKEAAVAKKRKERLNALINRPKPTRKYKYGGKKKKKK